eukprot:7388184-Prymnesium_polylepis.1
MVGSLGLVDARRDRAFAARLARLLRGDAHFHPSVRGALVEHLQTAPAPLHLHRRHQPLLSKLDAVLWQLRQLRQREEERLDYFLARRAIRVEQYRPALRGALPRERLAGL